MEEPSTLRARARPESKDAPETPAPTLSTSEEPRTRKTFGRTPGGKSTHHELLPLNCASSQVV